MKTPAHLSFGNLMPRASLAVAVSMALSIGQLLSMAQVDDFNDGNDNGWFRYDPLAALGQGSQGIWTLANGRYQLQALPSPSPSAAGPGRIGSLRQDVVRTNFYVAVDFTAWDNDLHQSFGILARVHDVGLGSTKGYALTYQTFYKDIQLSVVTRESATQMQPVSTTSPAVTLYPTNVYRMVFIGQGDQFEGRIYLASDLSTPLVVATGTDSTYAAGTVGLVVYDNSSSQNNPADATFDNFVSAASQPVTLGIQISNIGEVTVTWPVSASGFSLQWSEALGDSAVWNTVSSGQITTVGGEFVYMDDGTTGTKFFRLAQ